MSPLMKTLGIDRLSVAERLELVQDIWDSVAEAASQTPLTDAHKQELDRRLAAYEADPNNVIPWEVAKAQAEARLRR